MHFLSEKNVLEEAENALVIYGSDRLGTIYGLFHLSELLGVTPMLYWGIVLTKKENLVIIDDKDNYISKEPSVAYRGFLSMMNGHVLEHGQHHTLLDLMQKCMIIFSSIFYV